MWGPGRHRAPLCPLKKLCHLHRISGGRVLARAGGHGGEGQQSLGREQPGSRAWQDQSQPCTHGISHASVPFTHRGWLSLAHPATGEDGNRSEEDRNKLRYESITWSALSLDTAHWTCAVWHQGHLPISRGPLSLSSLMWAQWSPWLSPKCFYERMDLGGQKK